MAQMYETSSLEETVGQVKINKEKNPETYKSRNLATYAKRAFVLDSIYNPVSCHSCNGP
ncbi:Uncharacterised protein [Candidatus Tiddalikarchaeum anstoanum]|nr:Uncharacterised protein [Candidatus Tiddalikarchaeum anstoanum]